MSSCLRLTSASPPKIATTIVTSAMRARFRRLRTARFDTGAFAGWWGVRRNLGSAPPEAEWRGRYADVSSLSIAWSARRTGRDGGPPGDPSGGDPPADDPAQADPDRGGRDRGDERPEEVQPGPVPAPLPAEQHGLHRDGAERRVPAQETDADGRRPRCVDGGAEAGQDAEGE